MEAEVEGSRGGGGSSGGRGQQAVAEAVAMAVAAGSGQRQWQRQSSSSSSSNGSILRYRALSLLCLAPCIELQKPLTYLDHEKHGIVDPAGHAADEHEVEVHQGAQV